MPTTEKQRPVLPRIRIEAVQEAPPVYLDPVRQSGTIWAFFRHEFARLDRERFVSLALDGKNRVVAVEDVSTGSLTASLVHPREVMKVLILANAAAFICCHNHASGDPTPSAEDREVTQRLHDVGELMGIRLLDPSCSAPRATTRSLTTATCSAVYPGAGSIGSSHAVPAVASGDSDRRHSEDSPPHPPPPPAPPHGVAAPL